MKMKVIISILVFVLALTTVFSLSCCASSVDCELSLTHDGIPVHCGAIATRPGPEWQEALLPPGATLLDFEELEFAGKGSIHLRKRDKVAIYIDNHYLPLELTVTIAGQKATYLITGDAIEHEYDEGSNDFSYLAFELDSDGNGIRILCHRYMTRMELEGAAKYIKEMYLMESTTN